MKKNKVLKWIILGIAVAINIFIIVNSLIRGEASAHESNSVAHVAADIINTVKPETITEQNFPTFAFDVRKAVGHFGLFALSGGFSTWSLYLFVREKKIGYFVYEILMSLGGGFIIALLSEFLQKFTDGRTGAFLDVGIDMGGYFIGVLLVILILLIRKSPIFKLQKNKKNQAE